MAEYYTDEELLAAKNKCRAFAGLPPIDGFALFLLKLSDLLFRQRMPVESK